VDGLDLIIMQFCYYCNTCLSLENSSEEHVIPNSIGGRLRNKDLLCKNCNSVLGQTIDAQFANKTHFFMHQLRLAKQIGKVPDYKVQSVLSNCEYVLNSKTHNGKLRILQNPVIEPIMDQDGKLIEIKINGVYRDKSHLRQHLQGLKRQEIYKQLDIDKIISQSDELIIPPGQDVFKEDIGTKLAGEEFYCGILKIAINYYLHSNGVIDYIIDAISALKQKNTKAYVNAAFIQEVTNLYCPQKDEINHIVVIQGNAKEQILYGYIEIFNFPYVVILSKHYTGKDFFSSYILNLNTNRSKVNKLELHWTKLQIENMLLSYGFDIRILQQRLERFMKLAKQREYQVQKK
jgi:hypothetical protein